jgi:hypothetical protein
MMMMMTRTMKYECKWGNILGYQQEGRGKEKDMLHIYI